MGLLYNKISHCAMFLLHSEIFLCCFACLISHCVILSCHRNLEVKTLLKAEVKKVHMKPKKILKKERIAQDYSINAMALLIGVNRNQYRAKEQGLAPFKDYEISIISKELGLPIEYLFFID